MFGGLVAGAGAAVLVQQHGIAPLTPSLALAGLAAGLAAGVAVPSLAFGFTVLVHNRRLRAVRRTRATGAATAGAMAVLAAGAVLAVVVPVRPAAATTDGPCIVKIQRVDVAERAATKSAAIFLSESERLRVSVRSLAKIDSSRLSTNVAGVDVEVATATRTTDLSHDPRLVVYEVDLGAERFVGGGLHELSVESHLAGGETCRARVMVDAAEPALGTFAGRAALGMLLLGALMMLASAAGAARGIARNAGNLRQAFDDLDRLRVRPGPGSLSLPERARVASAASSIPAAPANPTGPWARPAATVGTAAVGGRAYWWQQDTSGRAAADAPAEPGAPVPAAPVEAEAPAVDDALEEATPAPSRRRWWRATDPDQPEAVEARPQEATASGTVESAPEHAAVPEPEPAADASAAREPERGESTVAPDQFEAPTGGLRITARTAAHLPLPRSPEEIGAPAEPDATVAPPARSPTPPAWPAPPAPLPRRRPRRWPRDQQPAEPEPPAPEPVAAEPPTTTDPQPTAEAEPEPEAAGRRPRPWRRAARVARDVDDVVASATPAPSAPHESSGTEVDEPESAQTTPAPAEAPAAAAPRGPAAPGKRPTRTDRSARPAANTRANALAVDPEGAGVLGPVAFAQDLDPGPASKSALQRWVDPNAHRRAVPDLERRFDAIVAGLELPAEMRERLSAAIDRDALRAAAQSWVTSVGHPPDLLVQVSVWRARRPEEVVAGVLAPGPYLADIARRAVLPAQSDHDWDLLIQEVIWPWV
jgi:hypothetical protein